MGYIFNDSKCKPDVVPETTTVYVPSYTTPPPPQTTIVRTSPTTITNTYPTFYNTYTYPPSTPAFPQPSTGYVTGAELQKQVEALYSFITKQAEQTGSDVSRTINNNGGFDPSTLTTSSIAEGTNLYYTDARVSSFLSASTTSTILPTITNSTVNTGTSGYTITRQEPTPPAPTTAQVVDATGGCTAGTHVFAVVFNTINGHTLASPASAPVTCDGSHTKVSVIVPTAKMYVISRDVYASKANTTSPLFLISASPMIRFPSANPDNGESNTYTFTTSDASLSATIAPTSNTSIDPAYSFGSDGQMAFGSGGSLHSLSNSVAWQVSEAGSVNAGIFQRLDGGEARLTIVNGGITTPTSFNYPTLALINPGITVGAGGTVTYTPLQANSIIGTLNVRGTYNTSGGFSCSGCVGFDWLTTENWSDAGNGTKLNVRLQKTGSPAINNATFVPLAIDSISGSVFTGTTAGSTTYALQVNDTNNLSLFSVRDDGKVGIGTTSPWGFISINPNGVDGPEFAVGSSTKTDFVINNGGLVGIGTSKPIATVHIQPSTGTGEVWQYIVNSRDSTSPASSYVENNLGKNLSIKSFGSTMTGNNAGLTRANQVALIGGTNPSSMFIGMGSLNPPGIIAFGYSPASIPAMVITTVSSGNGNLGIGTSSPLAKLDLAGDNNAASPLLQISSVASFATTTRFIVTSAGNVGISTTTPSAKLALTQSANTAAGGLWIAETGNTDFRSIYMDTSGVLNFFGGDTAGTLNTATLNAAGAWIVASDIAYKDNIIDLKTKYTLSDLMKLQPRFYTMKGSGKPQIGFIAQEVKFVIPEVVEGTDGSMGISYGNLVAMVVEGVKELSNKVDNFITNAKEIIAGTIRAKDNLCVGETCVTEAQLKALLILQASSGILPPVIQPPNPQESTTSIPTPSSNSENQVTATSTIEITPIVPVTPEIISPATESVTTVQPTVSAEGATTPE